MLEIFQWMQNTSMAAYFLENTWSSPIIQCAHLVALVAFSGAILVVDVRLLGRGLINTPLEKLAKDAHAWVIWSFAILFLTGFPQMVSTALKQYYSPFFWLKMNVMLFGLIFTLTIRHRVAIAGDGAVGTLVPKLVGFVSIATWTTVAVWARLIGLLS